MAGERESEREGEGEGREREKQPFFKTTRQAQQKGWVLDPKSIWSIPKVANMEKFHTGAGHNDV